MKFMFRCFPFIQTGKHHSWKSRERVGLTMLFQYIDLEEQCMHFGRGKTKTWPKFLASKWWRRKALSVGPIDWFYCFFGSKERKTRQVNWNQVVSVHFGSCAEQINCCQCNYYCNDNEWKRYKYIVILRDGLLRLLDVFLWSFNYWLYIYLPLLLIIAGEIEINLIETNANKKRTLPLWIIKAESKEIFRKALESFNWKYCKNSYHLHCCITFIKLTYEWCVPRNRDAIKSTSIPLVSN